MDQFFIRLTIGLALLLPASQALAWKSYENVEVRAIMQWQGGGPVYVSVAENTWCWIPAAETNLIALVLSAHAGGGQVSVHCADAADANTGGVPAYRLHRMVLKRG